jgi:hypothetical protein
VHRRYGDEQTGITSSLVIAGPLLAEDSGTHTGQVFALDVSDRGSPSALWPMTRSPSPVSSQASELRRLIPTFRGGQRSDAPE